MIKIGQEVHVTEPKHPDSPHKFAFVGLVADILDDGLIIVEDQESYFFCVEPDEIEENGE